MITNSYRIYNNDYKLLDLNNSYIIHNTTDKAARGEVSFHLNAFACPSPIEERKFGVSGGRCLGPCPSV